jgi:hypothetical protein
MVAADEVTAIALGDRKITRTDCHHDGGRHLFDDAHHVVGTVRTADEAGWIAALDPMARESRDVSERFVAQAAKKTAGPAQGKKR